MSRLAATVVALWVLGTAPQDAWAADNGTATPAEVQRLRAEASKLRERQLALRTELNAVGDRIEALKTEGSGLLRRDALEAQLRRSQELSSQLTAIAAQITQADEAVTRSQLGVVDALTAELTTLRKQLEATADREARRSLISRMRAVREDRERFSAALPRGGGVPTLSSGSSDDPEDLLEQADALRDSRDKVQKRLAAIDKRVTQLRQEQELERRMNEFVESDSLFDENDRRLGRSAEPRAAAEDAPDPLGMFFPSPAAAASPAPELDRDPTFGLGQVPADDLRALEAEQKRLAALAAEFEARARDAESKALQLR